MRESQLHSGDSSWKSFDQSIVTFTQRRHFKIQVLISNTTKIRAIKKKKKTSLGERPSKAGSKDFRETGGKSADMGAFYLFLVVLYRLWADAPQSSHMSVH